LVRDLNELAARLIAQLLAYDLGVSDERRLFFATESLESDGLCIAKLELEPFVPLVWQLFFEFGVGFTDELAARLVGSEEGREVILECLFIRFGEGISERLEEFASALLIYPSLLLDDLFGLQFLLQFALERPLDVYPGPSNPLSVDVASLAVHLILEPHALVGAAVGVLDRTLALLPALAPLARVDSARDVAVSAIPLHEIVLPVTLVLLVTYLLAS